MKHVKKCMVLISVWISKGSPPDKCMKRSRGDWFYSYFRKVTKKPPSGDNTPAPTSSRNSSIHYHKFYIIIITIYQSSLIIKWWYDSLILILLLIIIPLNIVNIVQGQIRMQRPMLRFHIQVQLIHHILISLSSSCHRYIPAITHHHHNITTSRYDSPSSSTSSSWISLSRAKCYKRCWEASFRCTIIIISTSYGSDSHKEIMVRQIIITIITKLQTALARFLDELERNQKKGKSSKYNFQNDGYIGSGPAVHI